MQRVKNYKNVFMITSRSILIPYNIFSAFFKFYMISINTMMLSLQYNFNIFFWTYINYAQLIEIRFKSFNLTIFAYIFPWMFYFQLKFLIHRYIFRLIAQDFTSLYISRKVSVKKRSKDVILYTNYYIITNTITKGKKTRRH